MRNLYIVKGIHSFPGIELDIEETELIDRANNTLLESALRGKRTGYFFDGKVAVGAKATNELIGHYEQYLRLHLSSNPSPLIDSTVTRQSIDRFLETFWLEPLGKELKKTIALVEEQFGQDYSIDSQLPRLALARVLGYEINFLPTETDPNPITLLKNKIPDSLISQIIRAQETLPYEEFFSRLYSIPHILDLLISQRDTDIFANVNKYGLENNVLFIGSNHPLREFTYQFHDFKIIQTIID